MTELWTDKPPIGAEEVARAEQILQKYKVGKAALDQRLVDNELWFRMGHLQRAGAVALQLGPALGQLVRIFQAQGEKVG